jgi:hypothetical protein
MTKSNRTTPETTAPTLEAGRTALADDDRDERAEVDDDQEAQDDPADRSHEDAYSPPDAATGRVVAGPPQSAERHTGPVKGWPDSPMPLVRQTLTLCVPQDRRPLTMQVVVLIEIERPYWPDLPESREAGWSHQNLPPLEVFTRFIW